jgi:hypothetical protein
MRFLHSYMKRPRQNLAGLHGQTQPDALAPQRSFASVAWGSWIGRSLTLGIWFTVRGLMTTPTFAFFDRQPAIG